MVNRIRMPRKKCLSWTGIDSVPSSSKYVFSSVKKHWWNHSINNMARSTLSEDKEDNLGFVHIPFRVAT